MEVPVWIAALMRSVVIAAGGIVVGLAVGEAILYFGRWREYAARNEGSRRLLYIGVVRVGVIMATLSIEVVLALRLTDPLLTWRIPLAAVTFGLLIAGMTGILRDDERRLDLE